MLISPPPLVWPIIIVLVLVAPVIGSFLGVLIRRIPRDESFVYGRSHCEACSTTLTARDLIPIVSYLGARGNCRHCGAPIARAHLHIELAALVVPIVAGAVALTSGSDCTSTLSLPGDCILGWALLSLAWIDIACLRLPDAITLPMLLAGLVEGALTGGLVGLEDRALGAVIGWFLLTCVRYGYRALRKRDGLGGGDIKLLAMGGAWIGVSPLPTVILIAALAGLLWAALPAVAQGREQFRERLSMATWIPFGPSLAGAIWLARLTSCVSPGFRP